MELLLFLLVLVLAICGMWSVSILVTVGRLRQYNTHGISRPGQTIEREIRQATRNNVPDILWDLLWTENIKTEVVDGWMDGLLVGWFSCRSSSLVALYLFFCLSLHICHGMKESNCGREGGSKNCLCKVLDVEMTGYLTGLSELALIEWDEMNKLGHYPPALPDGDHQ